MDRPFDVSRYLRDNSIDHVTEGHKHCQPGWIQVPCPFCTGNPGYHLGFSYEANIWNCWRCGRHSKIEVIRALQFVSRSRAIRILKDYQKASFIGSPGRRKIERAKTLKWPIGTSKQIYPGHKRYLMGRGFDPGEITRKWKIRATGPVGPYSHRILIPIYHRKTLVSYQGRDITGRAELKYKACRQEDEVIHHKETLYGLDYVETPWVFLLEGVLDVWRVGKGRAVSGFGVKLTEAQLRLLCRFETVVVWGDPDPAGEKEFMKVSATLQERGVRTIEIDSRRDPAETPKDEINEFINRNLF